MSDIIITPASGKIDFYQDLGTASLAKIELTSANDLSLSTTSGNLIIGDASRDIYIGNGINDVDIIFEQNGEIRSLPAKTLNIGTSGSFTQILASKVNINQNSFTSIPLDVYSSTSGATILNVAGTKGTLFSVTDNLSGSLMSVNNNAGLPVFEVFSDDRVIAGRFGQNDFVITSGGNIGIGTGVPSSKFHVIGASTFNGDISSTGSFIAGSGSAANPSFEFIGDTDTGMFTPSGNIISFATSGVERVRIDNIGRVGIGTTSPIANLSVTGNAVFGETGSSIGATVSVKRIGNNYNLELVGATDGVTNFAVLGGSTNMLWTSRANYFDIQTNTAGKGLALTTNGGSLFLSSSGNVGIGLNNPSYPLHFTSGLVSGYLYFGDNTKNIIANGNNLDIGAGDSIILKTAGNTALIADGDGYDIIIPVGLSVGTVNRTATLEVEGSFLLHDSGPYDVVSANPTNGLRLHYDGGIGGAPFFYTDRSNGRIGIKQESPSGELHVVGTAIISDKLGINKNNPAVQLDVIGTGNFSALTINNSGVALYDTTVANLGTISGSNSINCGQDRQIQNLTLNGVATTFTKGSGWPTSNSVARETTLNIFASGNTSVAWTIVNDWYRQPDSPLPSGRHIVLLRSIGSGTMQGHYIGNKTN